MRTCKDISVQEQMYPTHPRSMEVVDIDEQAKLWVEMVLKQLQSGPLALSNDKAYNLTDILNI